MSTKLVLSSDKKKSFKKTPERDRQWLQQKKKKKKKKNKNKNKKENKEKDSENPFLEKSSVAVSEKSAVQVSVKLPLQFIDVLYYVLFLNNLGPLKLECYPKYYNFKVWDWYYAAVYFIKYFVPPETTETAIVIPLPTWPKFKAYLSQEVDPMDAVFGIHRIYPDSKRSREEHEKEAELLEKKLNEKLKEEMEKKFGKTEIGKVPPRQEEATYDDSWVLPKESFIQDYLLCLQSEDGTIVTENWDLVTPTVLQEEWRQKTKTENRYQKVLDLLHARHVKK